MTDRRNPLTENHDPERNIGMIRGSTSVGDTLPHPHLPHHLLIPAHPPPPPHLPVKGKGQGSPSLPVKALMGNYSKACYLLDI